MDFKIEKAAQEDWAEVIDLANYVFSHSRGTTDFLRVLPKLYKQEYFMDSTHYIVREEGRIKASLGAYPLKWEFNSGHSIAGCGVGMVSVHPYFRSRGYMSEMLKKVLDEMYRDGIVFTCLSGDRHRYENYGYTPVGSTYAFYCYERNIRHTLGLQWISKLSLISVKATDTKILEEIRKMHEAKMARMHRREDRFFEILYSWRAEVFAIMDGDKFIGYFICRDLRTGEHIVIELNMNDYSLLPQAMGLYVRQTNREPIRINANPHEWEKIAALFGFTETHSIVPAYHFAIFDIKKFTEPFLQIASKIKNLADGSFSFIVDDVYSGKKLRVSLSVNDRHPSIDVSEADKPNPGELCFNNLDAQYFLFSPMTAETLPTIRESVFLQSLLPLPLFYENTDGV